MTELCIACSIDEGVGKGFYFLTRATHTVSVLLVDITVDNHISEGAFIEPCQVMTETAKLQAFQVTANHDVTGVRNEQLPCPWCAHDLTKVRTTVRISSRLCRKCAAVVDATVALNRVEPRVGSLRQLS